MNIKDFLVVLFLAFLILTLPLMVFLVKQKWLLPKAAELPSPLIFTPTSGGFPVDTEFSVVISLNTEGRPIEGVDLVVVAHNLEMTVEKLPLPEEVAYQKEPEVFKGTLKLSLLAEPGKSYRNTTPLDLVRLTLRGRVSCQNARLTVDKNLSVVAANGQNIIGEPVEPNFVIQTPEGITNPEFTSPTEAEAVLNQDFFYTAAATNPNSGVLDFKFYHLPDFLLADGPNLSGTPDQTGDFLIDMEVTDGKGGSACATLNLSIFDSTPIEITAVQAIASFNRATITWKTNREATSQVEYGKTSDYGNSTEINEDLVKDHAVALTSLEELTTYHFRVRSTAPGAEEVVSEDHTFTTTATPTQSLNIKFQFQGKKANRNNHSLTIRVKGTDFEKEFTGNPDGTYSFSIKGELENREEPYEILLKGYQNLAVKRAIPIHDGPNPAEGYLDFGQLPCGDIAPAGDTDNMVNSLDWGYMVDEWNLEEDRESIADINDDLRVNSLDYSLLISRFGLKGEE